MKELNSIYFFYYTTYVGKAFT